MSLAVFAALVAAITVVASMTVIAAVGLLFYSSSREQEPVPFEVLAPIYDATEHGVTVMEGPIPLAEMIDARRLVGFFDDEDSSLGHFDPQQEHRFDAAFGTPEWTEEEGATEIFSSHDESAAAFAEFEESVRVVSTRSG